MAIQVTKQVQKNPFISYILSDQVWWYNIKWSLSDSKNYICKFMQANLWRHKLLHFHLPFWIWKRWKGREKITKVWISQERKNFLDEIKNILHSFWRPIIWWKNKNLIRNSGHKLSYHPEQEYNYYVQVIFKILCSCILYFSFTASLEKSLWKKPSRYFNLHLKVTWTTLEPDSHTEWGHHWHLRCLTGFYRASWHRFFHNVIIWWLGCSV